MDALWTQLIHRVSHLNAQLAPIQFTAIDQQQAATCWGIIDKSNKIENRQLVGQDLINQIKILNICILFAQAILKDIDNTKGTSVLSTRIISKESAEQPSMQKVTDVGNEKIKEEIQKDTNMSSVFDESSVTAYFKTLTEYISTQIRNNRPINGIQTEFTNKRKYLLKLASLQNPDRAFRLQVMDIELENSAKNANNLTTALGVVSIKPTFVVKDNTRNDDTITVSVPSPQPLQIPQAGGVYPLQPVQQSGMYPTQVFQSGVAQQGVVYPQQVIPQGAQPGVMYPQQGAPPVGTYPHPAVPQQYPTQPQPIAQHQAYTPAQLQISAADAHKHINQAQDAANAILEQSPMAKKLFGGMVSQAANQARAAVPNGNALQPVTSMEKDARTAAANIIAANNQKPTHAAIGHAQAAQQTIHEAQQALAQTASSKPAKRVKQVQQSKQTVPQPTAADPLTTIREAKATVKAAEAHIQGREAVQAAKDAGASKEERKAAFKKAVDEQHAVEQKKLDEQHAQEKKAQKEQRAAEKKRIDTEHKQKEAEQAEKHQRELAQTQSEKQRKKLEAEHAAAQEKLKKEQDAEKKRLKEQRAKEKEATQKRQKEAQQAQAAAQAKTKQAADKPKKKKK
jgi:hypothetical protein